MSNLPSGIRVLGTPGHTPNAGFFTLPVEFNSRHHAAQWVKKGPAVDRAQQVQPIIGTQFGSDGWSVWKYPEGHKLKGRPAEVTLASGQYILMFRPIGVQQASNAIYGNVSKRHLIKEQAGHTIGGQPITDPGILNDERLTMGTGIREFGEESFQMPLNPEPLASKVEAPPVATGTTTAE